MKSFNSAKTAPKKADDEKGTSSFEYFILFIIFVNTFILILKWPNMNPKVEKAVDIVNYVCTSFFIIEALIKITALGRNYFHDGWNVFDFVIVVGSIIFISPTFSKQKKLVTMIRAFRISRVLKLINKF